MMKVKLYIVLLVASVSFYGAASDGTNILYSINMPGNPFQQPYYQMMIKADNANRVYPFRTAGQAQVYTFIACNVEAACGSSWDAQMNVTSDYVSLYTDNQNHISIVYGLSPYTFRGYTEGAASKLYMQRPAQVQLPFNPVMQQNLGDANSVYVNATLPDYSDVFLAQTSASVYQSLGCSSGNCTIQQSDATTMPSWYSYIPRISGITRGFSSLFYGSLLSLTQPLPRTTFSPYSEEKIGWGALIAMGVSKASPTCTLPSYSLQIFKEGVLAQDGWLQSHPIVNGSVYFSFAPVISPGYAGDATPYVPNPKKLTEGLPLPEGLPDGVNNPINPLKTVLPTGDLTGNYSVNNKDNPYIIPSIQATTYDGLTLTGGMSYFQLFAQNMQWFSLLAPVQTPLNFLATAQNITPGQGIFSDAIQLAAMEAPVAVNKVPVFTGSLGATAGITGPVMMQGAAFQSSGSANFNIPQAFLSELTVASFTVGRYLQTPSASQTSGTWSGGLVYTQTAPEDPLQYYQGIVSSGSEISLMMPYLPIYFSDPGRPVDQPGWSYCPHRLFKKGKSEMSYDTATSPMTNFYDALNGTR